MKVFHEHQSHLIKQQWQAMSQRWSINSKFLHYNKKESWQCFNLIIQPQPWNVFHNIQRTQTETKNHNIRKRWLQPSNDICHPFHQAIKMFDLIDSDNHGILNAMHRLMWKNRTSWQLTAWIMKWNRLHTSNESWLIVSVLF